MILAHAGITSGTLSELVRAWSWDPTVLVTLSLLAGLYAVGFPKGRRQRGRVFAPWRPFFFYTGLSVAFVALISPLDALTDHFFFTHMIQHMLLTMVAAPLVLLGVPVVPLLRGLPRGLRRGVFVPLARTPALRQLFWLLTHPIVAWTLFAATFWLWHVPALYVAALQNQALHAGEHVSMSVTAALFWWSVIDPVPFRARVSKFFRLPYLFLGAIQSGILGAVLSFAAEPSYSFYVLTPRLWGLSPLDDQGLGGLVHWILGGMIYLLAIAVVFFVMLAEEEDRTRQEAGA